MAVGATATANELSEADIEGRNIVQHLLAQRPAENFTNSGILKIRGTKRQRTEMQVELRTFVTETSSRSHSPETMEPENSANR